jgi:signal transduction histidine kinase
MARLNKRGHVSIEISDNGPGIPDDIVRRIFVPFFTTKREGSGVGLALSRQVMIAHGGTISVSPGDQGGTRFTLVF